MAEHAPPFLLAVITSAAIFALAAWAHRFPSGKAPALIRKADAVVTLVEPLRPHYVQSITFTAKDYLPGGYAQ